jgi:hypothetical protein
LPVRAGAVCSACATRLAAPLFAAGFVFFFFFLLFFFSAGALVLHMYSQECGSYGPNNYTFHDGTTLAPVVNTTRFPSLRNMTGACLRVHAA